MPDPQTTEDLALADECEKAAPPLAGSELVNIEYEAGAMHACRGLRTSVQTTSETDNRGGRYLEHCVP